MQNLDIYKKYIGYANLIHILPSDYLAGIFDGDGHIKFNSIKNKVVFQVTQHYSNSNLLWSLIKSFSCGSIYKKSTQSPILDWKTSSLQDIQMYIIPQIGHSLKISSKRIELERILRLTQPLGNFIKPFKGQATRHMDTYLSNDWIRGFIEAEGSFYFYLVNEFTKPQGKCAFSLVQKATQENFLILNMLNDFMFKNKAKIYLKKTSYELRLENQQVLFDYLFPFFEKNPLFFSKKIDLQAAQVINLFLLQKGTLLNKDNLLFFNEFKRITNLKKQEHTQFLLKDNGEPYTYKDKIFMDNLSTIAII